MKIGVRARRTGLPRQSATSYYRTDTRRMPWSRHQERNTSLGMHATTATCRAAWPSEQVLARRFSALATPAIGTPTRVAGSRSARVQGDEPRNEPAMNQFRIPGSLFALKTHCPMRLLGKWRLWNKPLEKPLMVHSSGHSVYQKEQQLLVAEPQLFCVASPGHLALEGMIVTTGQKSARWRPHRWPPGWHYV